MKNLLALYLCLFSFGAQACWPDMEDITHRAVMSALELVYVEAGAPVYRLSKSTFTLVEFTGIDGESDCPKDEVVKVRLEYTSGLNYIVNLSMKDGEVLKSSVTRE